MTIIGITGHMGAGKDEVASVLVADYGYTRIGFADGVKQLALAADPIVAVTTGEQVAPVSLSDIVAALGWDKAKREVDEVRAFLQRLGHAAREVIGPWVWIDALAARLIREGTTVVIADVRYPNEAREIRRWGGEVWRVTRPGFDGNDHPSEWGVDEIEADLVIENAGSLDDLRAQVRRQLMEVIECCPEKRS